MAARKNVWDLGDKDKPNDGPKMVEMWAVDADEAVKNDPDRYTFTPPEGAGNTIKIPDGWDDFSGSKRRGLAIRLGAPVNIKVSESDDFIQAEIDRRAEAASAPAPVAEPEKTTA